LKNLFFIVGLPTVGKTHLFKLLKEKYTDDKISFIIEDEIFLKHIHEIDPNIPLFKNTEDFVSWKDEGNRNKLSFLYKKNNNKLYLTQLFEDFFSFYFNEAKNNTDKLFFIDLGGYSHFRDFNSNNVIYYRFKDFFSFKKRFLHRYSNGEEHYKIIAPLEKEKLFYVKPNNIEKFYQNIDNLYLNKSSFVFDNEIDILKFIDNIIIKKSILPID